MRLNIINAALAAYATSVAQTNGVNDAAKQFNVSPAVQDKLEQALQESSAFLNAINLVGVTEQEGRAIGIGALRPMASRTDTSGAGERTPQRVASLSADSYKCVQTNFDTALSYAQLDAWAHKPEFARLVAEAIINGQALDRIMIGFNGTSVAATTNKTTNPLLQDVNKGWLQKLREYNVTSGKASQVLTGGATAGKITIGTSGDYKNIDALVFDLIAGLHPAFQGRNDLVAITSRTLLHDKYLPIIDGAENKATEKVAAEILAGARNLGGLPAVAAPHFPAGKVLVTPLKNLSLYWQKDARRRQLVDNAKKDQLENYESSNDAYVVEDLEGAMLAENIEAA